MRTRSWSPIRMRGWIGERSPRECVEQIKKPTCVGFFNKLVKLSALQAQQQEQRRLVRPQQERRRLVRRQQGQPQQVLEQQPEQEHRLFCHKQTKTEPTERRSARRISFEFPSGYKFAGVLDLHSLRTSPLRKARHSINFPEKHQNYIVSYRPSRVGVAPE